MKKTVLIFALLLSALVSFGQIQTIQNGESGLSVRNKINGNFAYVDTMGVQRLDSLLTAGITSDFLGSLSSDPASPVNGQMWYNSTSQLFRSRVANNTRNVVQTGITGFSTISAIPFVSGTQGYILTSTSSLVYDPFSTSVNVPRIELTPYTTDPTTSLSDGQLWYNSTAQTFKGRANNSTISLLKNSGTNTLASGTTYFSNGGTSSLVFYNLPVAFNTPSTGTGSFGASWGDWGSSNLFEILVNSNGIRSYFTDPNTFSDTGFDVTATGLSLYHDDGKSISFSGADVRLNNTPVDNTNTANTTLLKRDETTGTIETTTAGALPFWPTQGAKAFTNVSLAGVQGASLDITGTYAEGYDLFFQLGSTQYTSATPAIEILSANGLAVNYVAGLKAQNNFIKFGFFDLTVTDSDGPVIEADAGLSGEESYLKIKNLPTTNPCALANAGTGTLWVDAGVLKVCP